MDNVYDVGLALSHDTVTQLNGVVYVYLATVISNDVNIVHVVVSGELTTLRA